MKSLRLPIVASLAGLLAACGGSSTGTVSLLLKDAPGDFKAAVVTITEIDLVGSGGTTVLRNTKVTTDLATLANDTATLVNGAAVPPGTYTQLRFVISGGYIAVEQLDGSIKIYASSPTYEGLPPGAQVAGALQMPSYGQSGLKVDLPGGSVTVGTEAHVLLVDFDVQRSFGQAAGGSGDWVMHPLLTATEFNLTGTVEVTLTQGSASLPTGVTLGQFGAVLENSAGSKTPLPLVGPSSTGTYSAKFQFLAPGTYSVWITAPAGVTSFTTAPSTPTAASPMSVTVTSGQLTEEDFTLLTAN